MCPVYENQESIRKALQGAWKLVKKIESVRRNFDSLKKFHEQVGPDIQNFISSNSEFITFTNFNNQGPPDDLLLREILNQFCILKKNINPQKNSKFFQHNSCKTIEKALLKIREELNKSIDPFDQTHVTQRSPIA